MPEWGAENFASQALRKNNKLKFFERIDVF